MRIVGGLDNVGRFLELGHETLARQLVVTNQDLSVVRVRLIQPERLSRATIANAQVMSTANERNKMVYVPWATAVVS